jgi:hypothetical protein
MSLVILEDGNKYWTPCADPRTEEVHDLYQVGVASDIWVAWTGDNSFTYHVYRRKTINSGAKVTYSWERLTL